MVEFFTSFAYNEHKFSMYVWKIPAQSLRTIFYEHK